MPDEVLGTVSMMGAIDKGAVLEEWNDTARPHPGGGGGNEDVSVATAHELFEWRAVAMPGATALVFEGVQVTYGELLVRTARLVAWLRELSAGVDDVVGLCMEKSVEEEVGMVGVMRAGAAYVPLDPALPGERLRYLAEQCGCGSVIVQAKWEAMIVMLNLGKILVADKGIFSFPQQETRLNASVLPNTWDTGLMSSMAKLPLSSRLQFSTPQNLGVPSSVQALQDYLKQRRAEVYDELSQSGFLIFRGFDITSEQDFQATTSSVIEHVDEFLNDSPRTKLKDKVYKSTEYDRSRDIPFHQENS